MSKKVKRQGARKEGDKYHYDDAQALKTLYEVFGISQQRVADEIGVNRRTLYRIGRGDSPLTLHLIRRIAAIEGYVPVIRFEKVENSDIDLEGNWELDDF